MHHLLNMNDLSVSHMKNFIDGSLPEDCEWDGIAGNLPRLISV